MAARTRFCAQFTRSGRENQIGHRQSRSIIAAIVGAEVALNLEADVRVGVVAEVIIAIIDRASWEKVCAPVPCLHANGGVSGGKLLVLARLGGVGRRSGCKNQGERNGGYHQLDRKRCHGCILSSCRRSLPYPTSAAAQGRMVVHSITTRCRNIRGRQGLDAASAGCHNSQAGRKLDCTSLIAIAVWFGASSRQNCRGGGNGDGHSGGKPGLRALARGSARRRRRRRRSRQKEKKKMRQRLRFPARHLLALGRDHS